MENCQIVLPPEEVFNNKKKFSNKIHARARKVIDEISISFGKLEFGNNADKRSFLNTVNHYYHELCGVIFHLRKIVIKIDEDDQSVCDLQNVITKLDKIALAVQESLNLETEELKVLLKSTIADVGSQVEQLMEIVKYDNLHEHKQDVLDCQHNLVISTEGLKLYNQVCYLSVSQFERIFHEAFEKIKLNLIKIKDDHELLAEDFSHYTRHSVQYIQNIADLIRKMNNVENFPTDMSTILKSVEFFANEFNNDILNAVCFDNPMNKMLDIIENCHKHAEKAFIEFKKGLELLSSMKNSSAKKVDETVKQLIMRILVYGLNGVSVLNQSIEDAIMKK